MTVQDSLQRILHGEKAPGDVFYAHFFLHCPEAKAFFEGVNLRRQGVLLNMALMVIVQYHSHAYRATELYLKYLGRRHEELGIPVSLYVAFRDAMLISLEELLGQTWTPDLAQQWRTAIDSAIEVMREGHDQDFTL